MRRLNKGVLPILISENQNTHESLKSFRTLFETYYPKLCRQLTYILGERAAAEDLAQETFFKLFHCPPREWTNPGGWLSKVATNLAFNYLRGEKNRQQRESTNTSESLNTVLSLEETIFRNLEVKMVRDVLNELSPRDRICLLLKFSGYSYTEIASVIEVEPSSVGTILSRAQTKFKNKYLNQKGCDEECAMTKVPSRPI